MTGRGIAIAAVGLALLAAATTILFDRETPPPHIPATQTNVVEKPVTRQELEELLASLEFERHARMALAEEVAALRREFDADESLAPVAPAPEPEEPRAAEDQHASEAANPARGPAALGSSGFDTTLLANAELAESDIERLHERWHAHELEKLELSNLALREGWKGKQIRQERRALEVALQEELGDEYDAYLYATDRPNRLLVNDILADSAASVAGFEQGDLIVSYDGRRIYQPRELRSSSAACVEGAYVTSEVMRGGRLESLRLHCGPLGVLIDHVKQPPIVR